jgi:hypothetical protein
MQQKGGRQPWRVVGELENMAALDLGARGAQDSKGLICKSAKFAHDSEEKGTFRVKVELE